MSATAAGHAEMQALARISAPINGRTVFIRLNVPLSFAQFDPDVTGELIARRSARVQGRGRIRNRARKITLTRAFGAASPATRARRTIGGSERDILTRASPSILSYSGRGETGAGTLRLTNRSSILAHLRRPAA